MHIDLFTILRQLLFSLLLLTSPVLRAAETGEADRITVLEENEGARKRIRVLADEGRIAWSDVARGLARAEHLDETAVSSLLPSGSIDIRRRSARYSLLGISLAIPGVHLRVVQPQAEDELALEVIVDRDEFENTRRRFTGLIRQQVNRGGENDDSLQYGLSEVPGCENRDPRRPLVVVVHGFNSRPCYMQGLAQAIQQRRLACAMFGYPNDGPIAESARRLSATLKQHAARHPQQPIILTTSSMGGLVARATIESSDLDPGNVRQLIMIAPPNHGSALARIAHGLDIWEYLLLPQPDDNLLSICEASITDGLAEANRDLRPGSEFLRELNSGPRNANVRYSIILGTGGPLTEQQVTEMRATLENAARRSRTVQLVAPLIDDALKDMDEMVRGKGDGVVAVARGKLAGVDDVAVFDFDHAAASGTTPECVDDDVLAAVLERLPQ